MGVDEKKIKLEEDKSMLRLFPPKLFACVIIKKEGSENS
jgi:hypothetical protein